MIKLELLFRRYANILIALVLISGLALTLIGLSSFTWPASIPWSDTKRLFRFIEFLLASTILIGLLSRWLRWNTGLAFGIVVLILAIVTGTIWPLLLTLLFACASVILGQWLLGKLKLEAQNWLNSFLAGAGVYGTSVGLLAHFSVNYPGVYGLALALPIVLGWRAVVEQIMRYRSSVNNNHRGWGVNTLDVAISVVALVYFVVALMPEVGFDPLAVHLFVPAHLSLRHQWGFDASTYVWAVMPMLGDWIFSFGYMLAGETAARLINVGFIFILGWLVRDIVLWAGGSAIGARWAALIFLSTPLTFSEGSSLFIESIWTSFEVAGAFLILSASSSSGKPKSELPVAGFLLGCALAAKAATFTILPVLLLLLVWRYKSWFKTAGLQVLLLGMGLFSLVGIIPYVTALKLTGNPVFPLYNKIFQSPYFLPYDFSNPLYSSGSTWDVIYRMTFESGKYLEATAGASGFQWLLLLIPALLSLIIFMRLRGVSLLVVGLLAFLITFHSQSYLRYVFPSSVLLAAAIGVALSAELSKKVFIKYLWLGAALFTLTLNLLFINAGPSSLRDFPLISTFDLSKREEYLLTRMPIRNAVELVNHINVERNPVAVFAEPLTAGLSADALYPNWYNFVFQREISNIQTEQQLANILLSRNVGFVILDRNWNGVNCCGDGALKQALVEKVSEKITDYGPFSVRKVKTDYRFKSELLINSDFKSINGWNLGPNAKYNSGAGVILASENSPAVQSVAISPGVRYRNYVVARCAKEPALGRIQVNWIDSKGQIVNADIKTFDCTPDWAEHTMQVTAPPNATKAEVYVSGQTSTPLEFKSNSLKQ